MSLVTLKCTYQQICVAEKFLPYHETRRDYLPTVVWIYGPPGIGKTVLAFKLCGDDDQYVKKAGTKWWPGYDGHENIIFDDIREKGVPFMDLLGLLDSKPFTVEYKGGNRQFLGKRIFITSVRKPQHVYGTVGFEPIAQLMRRITTVYDLGDPETRASLGVTSDVPDVPEVGRVIIDLPTVIPPPLVRVPNMWGTASFEEYTPQEEEPTGWYTPLKLLNLKSMR